MEGVPRGTQKASRQGPFEKTVRIRTYSTTLPGAPDGEYVVILYDTSFENKKSAVETVTQMIDKDGNWHVAGYYIK